jgi:hypothetical protein
MSEEFEVGGAKRAPGKRVCKKECIEVEEMEDVGRFDSDLIGCFVFV